MVAAGTDTAMSSGVTQVFMRSFRDSGCTGGVLKSGQRTDSIHNTVFYFSTRVA